MKVINTDSMFQLLSILNVQEKYVPPAQLATRKPNLMSAKRLLGKFKWKARSMTAPDKLLHYNHPKKQSLEGEVCRQTKC